MEKRDVKIYSDARNLTRDLVGNKAYYLFTLANICTIPSLICLDADLFKNVLFEEENKKLRNKILQAFTNKLGLVSELETIQAEILTMYIPEVIQTSIKERLKETNMHGPYAVRSSSLLEDNATHSGAGVYESYTNVSEYEILDSVRKCWAAQFSVRSLSYNSDICSLEQFRIGIIIQEYKTAIKSGVMFSVDPVCPANGMRIEMVEGNSEKLMQGEVSFEKVLHCIENQGNLTISENNTENWIKELFEICARLRKTLNYEVDVEWAYDGNKVYILQCRQITTIVDEVKSEWLKKITEIDTIPIEELGAIAYSRKKFVEKSILPSFCEDLKIPCLGWYFLRYSKNSSIDKYVKEIVKQSGEGHYSIMMNKLFMDFQCHSDDLVEMLLYIINMARTDYITVSIRFIPHNEYSLISYYDAVNKRVRIECVPGVMKGLKSGYLTPTTFITDSDGKLIEKNLIHYTQYYEIDLQKDFFYTVECDMNCSYVEKYIEKIAKATVSLYNKFVSGVLEWWICEEEFYATDYSLESGTVNNKVLSEDADRIVLSKGNVQGHIVRMPEEIIEELDAFSYSCAVSVNVYDEKVSEIDTIKKMENFLLRKKKEYGTIILASACPYLFLSPFIQHVDGFIFKEASLLCHLSVIIREKSIPSVCIGEDFYELNEGDMYKI